MRRNGDKMYGPMIKNHVIRVSVKPYFLGWAFGVV
jgi:hypothetical protein